MRVISLLTGLLVITISATRLPAVEYTQFTFGGVFTTTTGSIHQVGKAIKNAPCNGWEHWYYEDWYTGERRVIDELRERVRQEQSEE